MDKINIGDRVEIRGDAQSYILVDPTKTYTGVVTGMGDGQLIVRLDEPVVRGPGEFQEVSVEARTARLARSGESRRS